MKKIISCMALAILLFACKKNEHASQPDQSSPSVSGGKNSPGSPSVVTTYFAPDIAYTTATAGGTIGAIQNNITERGVCWNTSPNPTISNFHLASGSGSGSFSCSITGLTANTTYYVVAYAKVHNTTSYGNQLTFTTLINPVYGTDIDNDGNVFRTIKIGTQIWMLDNLKTTHYLDGTPIPNVTDNAAWIALTTGAYCNYNNDGANVATYGRLYNFYAASDAIHILAPKAGWHVPSQAEWDQLETYLGGTITSGVTPIIGRKLKEVGTVHWTAPNPADNVSGFTSLPGGDRTWLGNYRVKDSIGAFWSSSLASFSGLPYGRFLHWQTDISNWTDLTTEPGHGAIRGLSVRCVKN